MVLIFFFFKKVVILLLLTCSPCTAILPIGSSLRLDKKKAQCTAISKAYCQHRIPQWFHRKTSHIPPLPHASGECTQESPSAQPLEGLLRCRERRAPNHPEDLPRAGQQEKPEHYKNEISGVYTYQLSLVTHTKRCKPFLLAFSYLSKNSQQQKQTFLNVGALLLNFYHQHRNSLMPVELYRHFIKAKIRRNITVRLSKDII